MAQLAFGTDANNISPDHRPCCATNCERASVIRSGSMPMCEAHLIEAYRNIGEYLRSKEAHMSPPQETEEEFVRRWTASFEFLKPPHGRCPECNWRLVRTRATNDVTCVNEECGYAATADDFAELFLERVRLADSCKEVVYYVRFGDRVKIGTTKDLDQRLVHIPHDEVMATEPGGVYVERQRHAQFKHLRADAGRGREWFTLTPELAEHIAAVQARMSAAS